MRVIRTEETSLALGLTFGGIIGAVGLAYILDELYSDQKTRKHVPSSSPVLILLYLFGMMTSRYVYNGVYTIYETMWGCNVAMFLAAFGIWTSRPLIIGMSACIVSGDQLCWYIDVVAYFLIRKCPIGVIKYLFYPENRSIPKRLFAAHHLWFLPLCLWHLKQLGGMPPKSFLGSALLTSFLAAYCRLSTPFETKNQNQDKHRIYLNINGAYEFWRDISIPILHSFDHAHPLIYLPFLSIVGNLLVNGLPSWLLFMLAST